MASVAWVVLAPLVLIGFPVALLSWVLGQVVGKRERELGSWHELESEKAMGCVSWTVVIGHLNFRQAPDEVQYRILLYFYSSASSCGSLAFGPSARAH
ncbi:hypothetical protein BDV39DRAFT_80938 [Aspergillus sergii]|uniref:Uncharacterized protein n=1 Tax=Aspergillus sergii TaxID=1034303 RepID=A0A5N6X777_9EURO|nr:hypothetical protein BDV39DRAFT_80938 [Aspergillus sergii]